MFCNGGDSGLVLITMIISIILLSFVLLLSLFEYVLRSVF